MAAERINNQQENNLIRFLIDDKYHSIDLLLSKMMKNKNTRETRLSSRISTKGCKYWQLILSILNILQKTYSESHLSIQNILLKGSSLNNPEYSKLSDLVKKIYNTIIYDQSSDFYQFFYNNDGNKLVNEFTKVSQLQEGINYLCLYDQNKESDHKHISHYFTILRSNDKYYLTSSYGSEFVCVPYNTLELNITELNNVIEGLNIINSNKTNTKSLLIIKSFYDKYFFQGNIPITISNDLMNEYSSFLKYLKIGSKLIKGPSIEFNYIYKNISNYTYHIGIIPEYESKVESYINTVISNNYTKNKKRKNITIQNNNNNNNNNTRNMKRRKTLKLNKRKN
jgi:hypothetical protein